MSNCRNQYIWSDTALCYLDTYGADLAIIKKALNGQRNKKLLFRPISIRRIAYADRHYATPMFVRLSLLLIDCDENKRHLYKD
jgi:hypothetical protein